MRERCGTGNQSQDSIDRDIFDEAYGNRDFDTMRTLANRYPEEMVQFLKSHHYGYYRCAAEKGALDLMKFLPELTPGKKDEMVQEMVQTCDWYCFSIATAGGHVAIMEHLVELASDISGENKVKEMIHASNDQALDYACARGQVNAIKYLLSLAPELKEGILELKVTFDKVNLVTYSMGHNHFDILKFLHEEFPDALPEKIKEEDVKSMAKSGFFHPMIDFLIQIKPSLYMALSLQQKIQMHEQPLTSVLIPEIRLLQLSMERQTCLPRELVCNIFSMANYPFFFQAKPAADLEAKKAEVQNLSHS